MGPETERRLLDAPFWYSLWRVESKRPGADVRGPIGETPHPCLSEAPSPNCRHEWRKKPSGRGFRRRSPYRGDHGGGKGNKATAQGQNIMSSKPDVDFQYSVIRFIPSWMHQMWVYLMAQYCWLILLNTLTTLQISRPWKCTGVRLKSQPTKSWGNDRFRGTMEMSKTYRQ